jgi:RNA polymerase-binding transcription factor
VPLGVTSRQLKAFERQLVDQLTALFNGVHEQVREAMVRQLVDQDQSGDEVDESLRAQMRDARMSLAENEARRAQEIEAAIGRIHEGTFGTCVDCGQPIELQRLKIVPWAARCIEDQTALERERQEHPSRL